MFLFVLALIIFGVSAGLFVTRKSLKMPMVAPVAALVVGFLVLGLSMTTVVSPKTTGVVVSFGKVSDNTLSPGLSVKAPWSKVIEIDGTIQTDEYMGENCVLVRIGDGSQGCVSLTIRWAVNPDHANTVYQDYRSNDPTQEFKRAVIVTQLRASTQKALAEYNPIAQLSVVKKDEAGGDPLSFAPDYDATSEFIFEDMQKRVGEPALADIKSVTISGFSMSDSTQKKLDDYVAEIGATRIAQQKEETARAQAAANRQLSASVSNDPNVLVAKCFDSVADAIEKGYGLPAGFSCWPGGGGGVVIPGGTPNTAKSE